MQKGMSLQILPATASLLALGKRTDRCRNLNFLQSGLIAGRGRGRGQWRFGGTQGDRLRLRGCIAGKARKILLQKSMSVTSRISFTGLPTILGSDGCE